MPDRFPAMEMAKANLQCLRRREQVRTSCPACKQAVILHDIECKIQVTGCLCTEIDRFGENEAIQRIIEREGEDQARARLANLGIYIPKGIGGN